jgi:hypothetical protein
MKEAHERTLLYLRGQGIADDHVQMPKVPEHNHVQHDDAVIPASIAPCSSGALGEEEEGLNREGWVFPVGPPSFVCGFAPATMGIQR